MHLLPPREIRDRLPPGGLLAWAMASLRAAVPHQPRLPDRIQKSGRFTDLARSLTRSDVADLDPRLVQVRALAEAGEPLPADPALLVVTALAFQRDLDGGVSDLLLRHARAGLDTAARRVRSPAPGTDLLGDLHALALGGLALEDGRALAWRREMLPRYWTAFAEATLEDGVPVDRSPGTLGRTLRDALLARTLWRAAGFVAPTDPMRRLRRMARAFTRLSRPGLGVHRFGPGPFLGGEERDAICALAARVLGEELTEPEGPWALPSGGFYGFTDPAAEIRLAVTAGRIAPGRLPRHEHADLLSWELDVGGRALVADPGGTGGAGALRDYPRTTRAHSTVTIDDGEQMTLHGGGWSGPPPELLDAAVEPDTRRFGLVASARLAGGAVHHRKLAADAGSLEVADRVEGAGGCTVRSLVHFAPEVRLQGVGRVLQARAGRRSLEIEPVGVSRLDVVVAERRGASQGWWFDDAGTAQPAPVLVLEAERYDGREIGCILRWRD